MATACQHDVLGRAGRVATTCAAAAWLAVLLVGTSGSSFRRPLRVRPNNPPTSPAYDALIKAEDRAHWAFQPIKRPPVPQVKNTAWVRNPIDAFVLAKLEEQGMSPAPAAAPEALLRRVYLDVTGLPPTPEERAAFLRDFRRSPDAVERLVDDLLARPARGERWARRWLDLVRYADSNGYERDAEKPFVWRYRDYVIRAFNADKPFDRFVLEQLAGDELPAGGGYTADSRGHGLLPAWALGRRAGGPETRPLRPDRRHRHHHFRGISRPDPRLRPLPQPQVRAADHARLLPHGRDLRAARTTRARPHRIGTADRHDRRRT